MPARTGCVSVDLRSKGIQGRPKSVSRSTEVLLCLVLGGETSGRFQFAEKGWQKVGSSSAEKSPLDWQSVVLSSFAGGDRVPVEMAASCGMGKSGQGRLLGRPYPQTG